MNSLSLFRLKEKLIAHETTALFILVLLVLLMGAFFAAQKLVFKQSNDQIVPEVDLLFDAEGPYALLYPRNDGNALILTLRRTASYDSISYELAYNSEGIDRGVMGNIDTKDKKGEYEQEILFGTCSKNVCKYDPEVENGTLTLHIRRGKGAYRMITQWHKQQPDVALGKLTSGDNHFNLNLSGSSEELGRISYTIINDLTGVPKLPEGRVVFGKVYAVNVPLAKSLADGNLSLELAENPPADAKVARFDEGQSKWVEFETKIEGSKLSAKVFGAGIFAVLTAKK